MRLQDVHSFPPLNEGAEGNVPPPAGCGSAAVRHSQVGEFGVATTGEFGWPPGLIAGGEFTKPVEG